MATKDDLYMLSVGTESNADDDTNPSLQIIKNNKIDQKINLPDKFIHAVNDINNTIVWYNNTLYIGGRSLDSGKPKPYVAYLENGSFTQIDIPNITGDITTITTYNNTIYIGGVIVDSNNNNKPYVAYLKNGSFTQIKVPNKDSPGSIETMTISNNTLYIGGSSSLGRDIFAYVAFFNNDNGSFVQINIRAVNDGLSGPALGEIYTITDYNGRLYIGGYTFDDNLEKIPYVSYYKYPDSAGQWIAEIIVDPFVGQGFIEVDTKFTTGYFYTMTIYNNRLYICGMGNDKPYVAYLEGESLKQIDILNNQSGSINTMTIHNNTLYIGGYSFDSNNYKPYVAYLEGESFIQIENTSDTKNKIVSLYSYNEEEDKKKENMGLIIGLILGVGLPIIILITYLFYRRIRK